MSDDLTKKKTNTLRKLAVDAGVKGAEEMERDELLAALSPENGDGAGQEDGASDDSDGSDDGDSDASSDEDADDEDDAAPEPPKAKKARKGSPVAAEPTSSSGIIEGHVAVGSKAEVMKARLALQPKVRILIPLEGKEKPGVTESVILNGYRLNIRKGEYVDVPEQVAEVIMEAQKQTISALNHPLKIEGENPALER